MMKFAVRVVNQLPWITGNFVGGINHLLEKVIQDSARRDDVGITSKFSSFTIHEPIFNLEKDMLGDLLFMSEAAPNF